MKKTLIFHDLKLNNIELLRTLKYYNISLLTPGLRVCPLSPIFWLVNYKLLIIEIKNQSQKR